MKIQQFLNIFWDILRFGGTPRKIWRHTCVSRHTGWETLPYYHEIMRHYIHYYMRPCLNVTIHNDFATKSILKEERKKIMVGFKFNVLSIIIEHILTRLMIKYCKPENAKVMNPSIKFSWKWVFQNAKNTNRLDWHFQIHRGVRLS